MIGPRNRIAIAAVLAVGVSGCFRPQFPGSDRVFPSTEVLPRRPGVDAKSPQEGSTMATPASKQVSDKEAPVTLIARDGSRCSVTAKRFASTREGDVVWCAWAGGR
jgi:hypothetical protein